ASLTLGEDQFDLSFIVTNDGSDAPDLNLDPSLHAGQYSTGIDLLRIPAVTVENVLDPFDPNGSRYLTMQEASIPREIFGTDGPDWLNVSGSNRPAIIHGGFGNDVILGGENADSLYGDWGNDD